MNDAPAGDAKRPASGEAGWLAAKKLVADRNEQARRSAKEDRAAHERMMLARQRALRNDSVR